MRVALARDQNSVYVPLHDATARLYCEKSCMTCGKTPSDLPQPESLMKCAGCKWAYYCSKLCQRKDWKTHKPSCDPDKCLPSHVAAFAINYEVQDHDAAGQSSWRYVPGVGWIDEQSLVERVLRARIPPGLYDQSRPRSEPRMPRTPREDP